MSLEDCGMKEPALTQIPLPPGWKKKESRSKVETLLSLSQAPRVPGLCRSCACKQTSIRLGQLRRVAALAHEEGATGSSIWPRI